jgi:hypothetical protein
MKTIIWIAFWLMLMFWWHDSFMQYLVNKPLSDVFFFTYKTIQLACFGVIAYALKPYNT